LRIPDWGRRVMKLLKLESPLDVLSFLWFMDSSKHGGGSRNHGVSRK
jgi:hypothetical protein